MTERTDRVNWSTLKAIGISPKHYLHLIKNPREDTDALRLGRVVHCLVFERDEFNARYIIEPRFNRAMNDDTALTRGYDGGKQAAAAWDERRDGREVVKGDVYREAYAIAASVVADPISGPIVLSGWSERKIEWEMNGIQCRGRVDHVNGCLADLKTTRSLLTFERDVARYGYHAQLAWYADGLEAAGYPIEGDPCLIAVESVPPYDVLVLTFTEEDLAAGRRVYRSALERLAACRASGLWPGISGGSSRRVVLPAWANKPEEIELTMDGEPLATT